MAQERPTEAEAPANDTTRIYQLDAVVVTAERVPRRLGTSTGTVSVLSGEQLRRLPLRNLAEALQQAPGFALLDFGGLGDQPQLTVRGFYGGGEAEYAVVLLDGQPLNGIETGLVNWDLIPLAAIESVEILRGGAAALYGDAAVGGVINLITRSDAAPFTHWSLSGGGYGQLQGSLNLGGSWRERPASIFADLRHSEGFREHAGRTSGTAGASLQLLKMPGRSLTLSTLHHARSYEEPGPLPGDSLAVSRTQVSPFFRFDRTDDRLHRLALDGRAVTAGGHLASGYLVAESRSSDQVRTLPLTPTFADTRERRFGTSRLLGSAQLELPQLVLPGRDRLLLGVDGSLGRLESAYYAFFQGPADAYRQATPSHGALDEHGTGTRGMAAGFFRYELQPRAVVLLSLGGRWDWLRDTFELRAPSEGERSATTHTAFSPKAGINLRYLSTPQQSGHLYANIARSFKAPTPDQLSDRRPIPVPFPPHRITISNPDLEPQFGTSVEGGLYHRAEVMPGVLAGELSLALYQMEMRNEIDFDLERFRYVNIGRSRHRGIETGLRLHGPATTGAFLNYTLQSVTSRDGEHAGKFLKAIPRHFVSGGLSAGSSEGLAGSLLVSRAAGIYLDDANTRRLPGFSRVDARLSYRVAGIRLFAEVFNLLDREYSTTGFPDPAGSDLIYYYPAAGRVVQVGLSAGR